MEKYQSGVKKFMQLAGQPTPIGPTEPSEETRVLRARLILEEVLETLRAAGVGIFHEGGEISFDKLSFTSYNKYDEVEYLDGLSDTLFVVNGGFVDAGFDAEPINDEVWENNLSKFKDGYRDENGKWRKGPSYKPVNLIPMIEKQKREKKNKEQQLELNLIWK